MEIPVLVRPTETGFRATAGLPFDFSEDAASSEAAVAAVRGRIAILLKEGASVVTIRVPDQLDDILARYAANPALDEYLEAIREARREREAEEDARERATMPTNGVHAPTPTPDAAGVEP